MFCTTKHYRHNLNDMPLDYKTQKYVADRNHFVIGGTVVPKMKNLYTEWPHFSFDWHNKSCNKNKSTITNNLYTYIPLLKLAILSINQMSSFEFNSIKKKQIKYNSQQKKSFTK